MRKNPPRRRHERSSFAFVGGQDAEGMMGKPYFMNTDAARPGLISQLTLSLFRLCVYNSRGKVFVRCMCVAVARAAAIFTSISLLKASSRILEFTFAMKGFASWLRVAYFPTANALTRKNRGCASMCLYVCGCFIPRTKNVLFRRRQHSGGILLTRRYLHAKSIFHR